MQIHKERNWKISENRLLDVSTAVRHLDGLQFSLEGLPFRALEQILYFLSGVGLLTSLLTYSSFLINCQTTFLVVTAFSVNLLVLSSNSALATSLCSVAVKYIVYHTHVKHL
jgi:hypothetical protein